MAGSEGAAGSGGLILVLNSGSSSVKFALLTRDTAPRRRRGPVSVSSIAERKANR